MASLLNTAFMREVGIGRFVWRTAIRQMHKRVLRRDHHMRLPTGDTMVLPRSSHFATEAFTANADVDWGAERLLLTLLPGHGVFLDVGANIGYYSLYMHRHATRTFAFEPDPRMRELLVVNVAAHDDIEVVAEAVGSSTGLARFALAPLGETSHIEDPKRPSAELIDVPMVTIDKFVAARGLTVAAIKTDVEGFDLDALRGAQAVLTTQRPIALSEIDPSPEFSSLLNQVDYRGLAFARQRDTRRISFVRIDELASDQVTKMIFAVPREREAEIVALATR